MMRSVEKAIDAAAARLLVRSAPYRSPDSAWAWLPTIDAVTTRIYDQRLSDVGIKLVLSGCTTTEAAMRMTAEQWDEHFDRMVQEFRFIRGEPSTYEPIRWPEGFEVVK